MTLADLCNRPRAVARVAERLDAEAEPPRSARAGRLERAGKGQLEPGETFADWSFVDRDTEE